MSSIADYANIASVIYLKQGIIVFPLSILVLLSACAKAPLSYVYTDLEKHQDEQKKLIQLFLIEEDTKIRFALVDKIASNLQAEHKLKTLTVFLQYVVDLHPNNPYNAYFLLRIASVYRSIYEHELAAYYFEYILQNYADMIVQDKSIHLLCLKNLIDIVNTPKKHIVYYSRLLTDFYESIDPAYTYFKLAQAYEKQGEWRSAIQTYIQFLQLRRFDVIIPGIPDSYGHARKIVDYSAASKNRTFNTLDELIKIVTNAIRNRDYDTLERCRSTVNFFATSWKQDLSDIHDQSEFNIYNFMHSGTINVAPALDPSSTPYEAYLRTSGWQQYIRTWYLYFKKINFPADPSIHGRWEWAGVFYGEKI